MSKAQLRKEGLARRKLAFSHSLSAKICESAAKLPAFLKAETIMLYISTGSEVCTARLLALCRQHGKIVCAPKVKSDTEMETVTLDESGFTRGAFGIWEPAGSTPAIPDLIFVPGVVFDEERNRIGYGKGYYDRFLQRYQAVTVGLAFQHQIIPEIPTESQDKQLDIVLTEEGMYT